MVICCKFKKNRFNLWLYTWFKNKHFETMEGWTWKAVCNEALFRFRKNLVTKFWCQQKPLVIAIICYKFKKKKLWSLILYIFFMILYMYIAPGQGLTTPWGRNFNVNRNILSLRSFVSKTSLWSLILHHFFSYFIHVYSSRSGADNHRGQNDV